MTIARPRRISAVPPFKGPSPRPAKHLLPPRPHGRGETVVGV